METVLEILKYTLPSLIVFATAYFMLKRFLDEKQNRAILQAKVDATKQMLPIKMQAYERLVLLLDRIDPSSLLMRIHKPGMSAKQLQNEMLQNIRNEFDHNSTQQLYVSTEVWNRVTTTKDGIVQLVNLSAEKMHEKSTGLDLSKVLIEIIARSGVHPTKEALEVVKNEARRLV
jgi:hypothetical protein